MHVADLMRTGDDVAERRARREPVDAAGEMSRKIFAPRDRRGKYQ